MNGSKKLLILLRKKSMTAKEAAEALRGQMAVMSVYTTLLRMLRRNLVTRTDTHPHRWRAS